MITKEKINALLSQQILAGRDEIGSIQGVFEQITSEYAIQGVSEKSEILHGIMFFANELFGNEFGYKQFDLVLSRSCPTSETMRFIEEQEGKNIWSEND